MNIDEIVRTYIRALFERRVLVAVAMLIIALGSLIVAASWPKSYTASATIFADNSNILRPLIASTGAVATSIEDQARMAQEILFNREFTDQILEAGGWDISGMSETQKNALIESTQSQTIIENVGRGGTSLISISHTDSDPIRAFKIAQKYTQTFIEESVFTKQGESRNAFEFIQSQVDSYQAKLQASENRLSEFMSENNLGTLANANNRIANYRAEIERLELDLVQIDTQIQSVESQLTGENAVVRDLTESNAIMTRINALQINLDALRSRFHDTYPDVVQVMTQIADLQAMLDAGETAGMLAPENLGPEGVTPLHQQLRAQLATLETSKQASVTQRNGLRSLLLAEEDRAIRINETEAELAELTRDYDVTQNFYNDLLFQLENARVSMHLDEEQQGLTFKIQESAVIPTQPDGLSFPQLMGASFILALCVPIGLIIAMVEIDPRIRTEANWSDDWPPLLATVPPMKTGRTQWVLNRAFVGFTSISFVSMYGVAGYLHFSGYF